MSMFYIIISINAQATYILETTLNMEKCLRQKL